MVPIVRLVILDDTQACPPFRHRASCVVFRVRMACALHSKGLSFYVFPRCLTDLLLPFVRDLMDTKDVLRDLPYLVYRVSSS